MAGALVLTLAITQAAIPGPVIGLVGYIGGTEKEAANGIAGALQKDSVE
jgi:hypothetical protein